MTKEEFLRAVQSKTEVGIGEVFVRRIPMTDPTPHTRYEAWEPVDGHDVGMAGPSGRVYGKIGTRRVTGKNRTETLRGKQREYERAYDLIRAAFPEVREAITHGYLPWRDHGTILLCPTRLGKEELRHLEATLWPAR